MFLSGVALGQDPSCEYSLIFKDVQSDLYDYEILVEDDVEKPPMENIKKQFQGNYSMESMDCALLKSESGTEIIIGFRDDYCYPNRDIQDQLRISIARKNKKTDEIDIMYATTPLRIGKTNIEIEKFVAGKREAEIYSFERFLKSTQNSSNWHNVVLQGTQTIIIK